MIAIALGQAIMSFNVAALPVSMGGMVKSFDVPPTTVGTGIVLYSLAVAGFVMLGAKLCQRFGALRSSSAAVVVLFGVAQVLMTFSPAATVMLTAQLLAGAGRGGHRAVAGGADRPPLSRAAAGDGHRRSRLGPRGGRGAGLYDRRDAGHLYRLAAGFRYLDRGRGVSSSS